MINTQYHQQFQASNQTHILMLTVHGVHEWDVVPGLEDTGGQNVFVNQFSKALAKRGCKVTIVNRGGYSHPRSGKLQSGLDYKDSQQRILYLEDEFDRYVRKEDMGDRFPGLVTALVDFLDGEKISVDLIISHYWDGGMLGFLLKRELHLPAKHIWVPHSLGLVKKRNLPPESWQDLRIEERIGNEREVFSQVDFVAATSSIIRETAQQDYSYGGKVLWLPPCVDQDRYYDRDVGRGHPIWDLLSDLSGIKRSQIHNRRIILEISRTDRTKQKDILIRAYAKLQEKQSDTLLVIAIDKDKIPLGQELMGLIEQLDLEGSTAVVGSIRDLLPALYAVTTVYCTPSIMEGFGMSVQEAAATKVPVISSDLVPFVTEYLVGEDPRVLAAESGQEVLLGEGALIVSPGDVEGFTFALDLLLSDENLRKKMGQRAYQTAIPYFTWDHIVQDFLDDIGLRG
ncbi:MAG: glycosyltransferase [Anaerolineales bacterium]